MTLLFTMSSKELDRLSIIKKLVKGEINGTEAAAMLHLSIRQIRRVKSDLIKCGPSSLAHGLRGKPGNRGLPEPEKEKIKELLNKHYADFKPGFAAEKLAQRHKIIRDPKTVRKIMIEEGLWSPRRKKRASKHRSWRQRRSCFGEMVQFDGSYHDWFEGRLPECCLLGAIDDATGRITKLKFADHEGVFPVFAFWHEYLRKIGRPVSIYLDKFSTYKQNQPTAKENHELKTQFGRAMEELMTELIFAHSPQAKGRIERVFETLQDRLVKELRLAGISDVNEANRYLEEKFVPEFNARFAVSALKKADMHRRLSVRESKKLDSIFSKQSRRTVQNDFTFSFQNQWHQLTEDQPATVCRKDVVIVEEHLNHDIKVRLRGKYLNYIILPGRPKNSFKSPWILPKTDGRHIGHKPPSNHPWRKSYFQAAKQNTKVGHF